MTIAQQPPTEDTPEREFSIDGETALAIYTDVTTGTPPQESDLTYTPEMLAFRAQVEDEIAQIVADNPDAMIDIPYEIPSLDVSGEVGVARSTQPQRNEDAVNALLRPDRPRSAGEQPDAQPDPKAEPDKAQADGSPQVITFGPGRTSLSGGSTDDAMKPLDYYVDIDFPPLEQKDAATFIDAMTKLSMLLPQGVEGKKLVIGLALNALGVNDVDQVMDLLVKEIEKAEKEAKFAPQQPGMPPGGGGGFRLPAGPQFMTGQQQGGGGRFGESVYNDDDLSEPAMRRIIEAVGEAASALEKVGGGGDGG